MWLAIKDLYTEVRGQVLYSIPWKGLDERKREREGGGEGRKKKREPLEEQNSPLIYLANENLSPESGLSFRLVNVKENLQTPTSFEKKASLPLCTVCNFLKWLPCGVAAT